MAGLIDKQMDGAQPPAEDPNAPQQGGESSDSDPDFRAALKFAMQALYDNGGADGVARALKADPSPKNLSDTAYQMVSVVDERTGGSVPDQLLAALAMQILKEVVDIAEAAGVSFKPSEIAVAFRDMILRYVEESGYDATQLRQAMEQVDPAQIDRAVAEQEVPEAEDAEESGEPPEGTPADKQEDVAEGEEG